MSCLGVHIALDEQQANALIAGTEQERLELLAELELRLFEQQPDYVAETDKSWDALHRALSDGLLTYDGGAYPLNHVVLGGRVLYTQDDFIVSYKTPQQAKDIAAALEELTPERFKELYWRIDARDYDGEMSEEDFEYTSGWFQGVRELYRHAAEADLAVVFTADQ